MVTFKVVVESQPPEPIVVNEYGPAAATDCPFQLNGILFAQTTVSFEILISGFTLTVCVLVWAHAADVVYLTVYVVAGTPLLIEPVAGLTIAPSVTAGSKLNRPPAVPVMVAAFAAPAQKSVSVKPASAKSATKTFPDLISPSQPF